MAPCLHRINQVCSSWRDIRHTYTHTHRTTTVSLVHAPRINERISTPTFRDMPHYTIYNEKYFSERQFSYIVRVISYMRAWIRVLDVSGCNECTARAERKSVLQGSGQARIGQNCRAVCTKKSGFNASGHSYS